MTIQAQTPDGAIHEFPDGTPDSVVDGAVKNYLNPQPSFTQNEEGVLGKWTTGNITAPSAALQTMGNEAQAGWDAAGNAIKDIPGYGYAKKGANAVWQGFKSGAQSVADMIDSPEAEQEAVNEGNAFSGIASGVSQLAKNHPEVTGDMEAIGKIIPVESAFGAAENMLGASSRNAVQSASDIAAKKTGILPSTQAMLDSRGLTADQVASMTPQQISKVKNGMYAEGLAKNIQDAKEVKNGIYSMANEVGNDDTFNAASTKKQLDSLHEKYRNDPAYDGTPLVRRLDSWRNMFDDDGSITPTRLNGIMDQVDDAYRENPKAPEGEVYNAIKTPLGSALNSAKEQFPNWGSLISTADDAHYNLKNLTEEDKTFSNKWSTDSHKDFQINSGKGNNPADLKGDTLKQITSLPVIKDEAELQKMMAFMPKELQGQYLTDVARNASTPLKIKNAIKSILYLAKGSPGWSFTNALSALPKAGEIAGWDADAATHIADRMQEYKDIASDAYERHQTEKLAGKGANASTSYKASTAQKMLPAPTATLALPAPPPVFKSGWSGRDTAPMTGEDLARVQAGRDNWPSVAPGEAQPSAAHGDAREPMTGTGGWQRGFMRENKGRPLSSTQGQEYTSPARAAAENTLKEIAGPEYADFLKRKGYAQGGAVPSPAQIEAGNYPKKHLKFQGMDISIETVKGQTRSGKDKGGKEWSVKMPADYGYIKRTKAADKEHIDCYIGPSAKSNRIYVIDQHHLHNGKYDEVKCMLGYSSRDEAVSDYKAAFSDGKGAKRMGKVTRMSVPEFKQWIKNHSEYHDKTA